ncbi:MAG: hypothetical protein ACTSVC_05000 [Promethearchaeota archaeon]
MDEKLHEKNGKNLETIANNTDSEEILGNNLETLIADIEEMTKDELWENIGFHRPIAGLFYNIPFFFITLIISIVAMGYLMRILYPFPESLGYHSLVVGLFSLYIDIFDLGTANMMNRFIGESNIKDPTKMLHYIQYFIWYQMITGLIQTTLISYYALHYVPRAELSYSIWIMLIFSTTQFPGMLSVFNSLLNTLQQYNKSITLSFISGQVFQRTTEIIFVLVGKYYGINHPEIGELMGIAIGATVGYYVDDFFSMLLSAYFFSRVLEKYGFRIRDCFGHDFDLKLLKECISWGIRSGIPGILWTVVSYTELLLWLRYVPQYATFTALYSIANGIAVLMDFSVDLGGSISEAFFNGKKELARYYIGQAWRYTGLLQFLMFGIILTLLGVLRPTFELFGIQYYLLAIPFIIPSVIRETQQPYNNIAMNVISSTGHVTFQMFTNIIESLLSIIGWVIYIPILNLPSKYGLKAVMWLLPCGELPGIFTKISLQYIFIQKKVLKLKIPWFQSFGATALSFLIYIIIGFLYTKFVFYPMYMSGMEVGAIIIMAILFLLILPFLLYFPLTAYFGGWDDGSLDILKKANKISGPGRIFSGTLYRLLNYMASRSRLHNRFRTDMIELTKELRELMVIKNKHAKEKIRIAK